MHAEGDHGAPALDFAHGDACGLAGLAAQDVNVVFLQLGRRLGVGLLGFFFDIRKV